MKKLMLMMVVLGTVAFGRDFEYREKQDLNELMSKPNQSQEMLGRARNIADKNMKEYSKFHLELMNMDRGHEDR